MNNIIYSLVAVIKLIYYFGYEFLVLKCNRVGK